MSTVATQTNGTVAAPTDRNNAIVEYTPLGNKTSIKLSVALVMRDLCKPTKQGHRCQPEEAMKFLMLCRARELDPWAGDAFLVGYDSQSGPEFSLITSHQAFLKRAEVNPNFDGMESGIIVQDAESNIIDRVGDFIHKGDTLLGGWAVVHVKGRKIPTIRRLNLTSRSKDNRFWKQDTGGMICKCAEADALRSTFPTTLGGLFLAEERQPIQVEQVPEDAPEPDKAETKTEALRKRIKEKVKPKEATADPAKIASQEQIDRIYALAGEQQLTAEQMTALVKSCGAESATKATPEQADAMIAMLQEAMVGE